MTLFVDGPMAGQDQDMHEALDVYLPHPGGWIEHYYLSKGQYRYAGRKQIG